MKSADAFSIFYETRMNMYVLKYVFLYSGVFVLRVELGRLLQFSRVSVVLTGKPKTKTSNVIQLEGILYENAEDAHT